MGVRRSTTAGRALLDANIVSLLLAGDKGVAGGVGACGEVALCDVVLGELFYGALRSSQPAGKLARIEAPLGSITVLSTDRETARAYGDIKNALRERGRPIPENDLRIAALARRYGMAVATRDEHFGEVSGIELLYW